MLGMQPQRWSHPRLVNTVMPAQCMYPYKFARLLHENESVVNECLREIRLDHEALMFAKAIRFDLGNRHCGSSSS